MNLVPPSSLFFFNGGPKNALSLSLDVKCDQQTQKKKKKMSPINASISKKIIQQSPMFLAGIDSPIRLRLFFPRFDDSIRLTLFLLGLSGHLWVRIMGISQNVMGSGYGSNISVKRANK